MADKLVMMEGSDAVAEHVLDAKQVLLGSDTACAIRNPKLSARHAMVERANGAWTLKALPGAPLEQDGRTLSSLRLEHGSTLTPPGVVFRYVSPKATIERTAYAGKKFGNTADAVAALHKARERILDQIST